MTHHLTPIEDDRSVTPPYLLALPWAVVFNFVFASSSGPQVSLPVDDLF
jgi:hypothetical protein